MVKSELEKYIENSIRKINELDIELVNNGVEKIHLLLLRLCQKIDLNKFDTNKSYLSTSTISNSIINNNSNILTDIQDEEGIKVIDIKENPIFNEFVKLQDKVNYNITIQMINLINRLETEEFDNVKSNKLIIRCLQILQGTLLIHPESRNCFRGKHDIKLLINILNPKSKIRTNSIMIIECVLMLVSLFIRNTENLRNFEQLDGIELICKLVKGENKFNDYEDEDEDDNEGKNENDEYNDNETMWQNVRMKSLEFLFFYLIPEFNENDNDEMKEIVIKDNGILKRSMKSKIQILKKYLNEEFVDGIVKEYINDKPFGGIHSDW